MIIAERIAYLHDGCCRLISSDHPCPRASLAIGSCLVVLVSNTVDECLVTTVHKYIVEGYMVYSVFFTRVALPSKVCVNAGHRGLNVGCRSPGKACQQTSILTHNSLTWLMMESEGQILELPNYLCLNCCAGSRATGSDLKELPRLDQSTFGGFLYRHISDCE
jgi:hypothetical protein